MYKNNNQNKTFTNLAEVMMHFSDKNTCKEYLKRMRWNGEIVCPHCNRDKKMYVMKKGYKCASCRKPFSVTKGTIFENSAVPLQKWFAAIWLITSHKKGVSSLQLHRDLGITQKSAWFMLQRIRFAIRTKSFNEPLKNVIETDETYVGEFEYRYNTKEISCADRFSNMLSLSNTGLTYKELIS